MPDLKTALSEALARQINAWEDHEDAIRNPNQSQPKQEEVMKPQAQPRIMNNVMRSTFDYIKANPGTLRRDIINKLETKGFKGGSVNSVISQLSSTKQIYKGAGDGLFVGVDEYQPITQVGRKKPHPKAAISKELSDKIKTQRKIVVVKRKKSAPVTDGIAALQAGTSVGELLRQKLDPELWKPETVVNNLNVIQARQLYDYLKKIFGG